MKASENCYALTKSAEQCRLTAYQDSAGHWTIGWGSTDMGGHPVIEGQTCSQDEADAQLTVDMQTAESDINELVVVPLTQNEYDALVDLAYNIGYGNFAGSTLLKLLNQRKYAAAGGQILVWNKAGGVILGGLVKRRKAEFDLYNAA